MTKKKQKKRAVLSGKDGRPPSDPHEFERSRNADGAATGATRPVFYKYYVLRKKLHVSKLSINRSNNNR